MRRAPNGISIRQIARELGISRTWATIIEFRAINKLRVLKGLESKPEPKWMQHNRDPKRQRELRARKRQCANPKTE